VPGWLGIFLQLDSQVIGTDHVTLSARCRSLFTPACLIAAVLGVVAVLGCGGAAPVLQPGPQTVLPLTCIGHDVEVTWTRTADPDSHPTLDDWCRSVGPPAVVRHASPQGRVRRLLVVSWNVHVGGGRVTDLLGHLAADLRVGADDVGLVLLLQEALRVGPDVPGAYPSTIRVPSAIRPRRPASDVVALGERLGLSVAYVPSMRNGPAVDLALREDRGNAVLSTEPLSNIEAIELPLGYQRRVAVAATLTPRGHDEPLRVLSLHFDTRGSRAAQAFAMSTQLAPDAQSSRPMLVGGDLNALRGRRDAAWRAMDEHLIEAECGMGRTNVWPGRLDLYVGWWLGRIDFIFGNTPALAYPHECWTEPARFGSDHRPVVMVIELDRRSGN
jgi:endonuclease/exonuclease/phosphatase family metal-dependent hydrolase